MTSKTEPAAPPAPPRQPSWPFLLERRDNRWYLNRARRRSRADAAADVGEAKW